MKRFSTCLHCVGALLGAVLSTPVSAAALAPAPATMRLDYQHSGNALSEHYAIERVVIEPLPWSGNPARPIDDSGRGNHLFEVVDPKSGEVLYSRGYNTVFDEWKSTDEAGKFDRGFEESLRFPLPERPVRVRVLSRDERNVFSLSWAVDVDPAAPDIQRKSLPAPATPIAIRNNGPSSEKVDLLILGDGYTQAQAAKFKSDARRLTDHLFEVEPFRSRAKDFNVWALTVPTPESGVSRPSSGLHHASALGTRYDSFGSERYVLTLDNRALRDLAQYAPYDFIEILVNNTTYGGGGIFGQFSTAAAGNDWAGYLLVHEFGHHFAGLADEYYTSPVAYQLGETRPEPWEPNVTALRDPAQLKWKSLVRPGTTLPTLWPKAEFEAYEREHQKERQEMIKAGRPDSEISALFREELRHTGELFAASPNRNLIGAFEGANYQASGYYRSEMQCMMFNRSDRFCQVCQNAISTIIDLYTRPVSP